MKKVILVSAATTLVMHFVLASPWLLFLLIWIGSGHLSGKIVDKSPVFSYSAPNTGFKIFLYGAGVVGFLIISSLELQVLVEAISRFFGKLPKFRSPIVWEKTKD